MESPALTEDEEKRLKALQDLQILDTGLDERFDRLTRMAARMFNVPIALVSLVDADRQWFKSKVGLDASETPRDISFCGHSILDDKVFVVPDASSDQRFSDNPLVEGNPNIRFYAGCPLQLNDEHRIGTLCIIDDKPRDLSEEDIGLLQDLTRMVEQELSALQSATIDELTDIPNRRGFMMLAQHHLNVCARQSIPASLVFIDLDHFKKINDELGHEEGDAALTLFAEQMRLRFRQSDIFARLGGDEFVVLLTNTRCDQAHQTVFAFQQNLQEVMFRTGKNFDLSFSYGAVEYEPDRHTSLEDMLRESDQLMYETKRQRH